MEDKIIVKPKINERTDGREVITVLLGSHGQEDMNTFRCIRCGKIVFNYYSEVRIIIIGEMREVSRPTDIMCRCKVIYRIS